MCLNSKYSKLFAAEPVFHVFVSDNNGKTYSFEEPDMAKPAADQRPAVFRVVSPNDYPSVLNSQQLRRLKSMIKNAPKSFWQDDPLGWVQDQTPDATVLVADTIKVVRIVPTVTYETL